MKCSVVVQFACDREGKGRGFERNEVITVTAALTGQVSATYTW